MERVHSLCVCSVVDEGAVGGEGEESQGLLSLQQPPQLEYPSHFTHLSSVCTLE